MSLLMIESIMLKNVACFDEERGVEIKNLGKCNFIYGANSSGKTTISNLIAASQRPDFQSSDFNQCRINWKDGKRLKCHVYNEKFKENHFGEKTRGVFTLAHGQKEVDRLQDIDKEVKGIQHRINYSEKELAIILGKKEAMEKKVIDRCWNKYYSKYVEFFKEAFSSYRGSKEKFAKKLLERSIIFLLLIN